MLVEKLFLSTNYPSHMVVETEKGRYGMFRITPIRKIVEGEIIPLPAFAAKGNSAEEAPEYLYQMYGIEKNGRETKGHNGH